MIFDQSFFGSRRNYRLRQAAVPIFFLMLGVVYASWAARIPSVRDTLQLSAAQLGMVLFCGGIGAVASFAVAAWMVRRFGARRAAWYSGLLLLVLLPCLALAPQVSLLLAAMAGLGAASSCFDVAINALGAEAERIAGRSIMSLLHAWFCVGTLSGALIGSLMAGMSVTPFAHFAAIAILLALLLRFGYLASPSGKPASGEEKTSFAMLHGPLITLGIIGFCGAMAEGSIADWSGVFMKDRLGAGEGIAPLGFAAFAALMLAARLACDRLKDRFGACCVVASGALLAAIGMFIVVQIFSVALTVAGFALMGAGLAALFPFVFSAAARHGPTALAGVATLSYSGSLIGPPLIGFLAQGLGLRAALAFIGVLSIVIAMAASRARWLE